MKKWYLFDPHTKMYSGMIELLDDSVVPSNSTVHVPPHTKDKESARFVNGTWIIERDERGEVYYNENGEATLIIEIGDVPDGYTKEKPKPRIAPLDEYKESALGKLKQGSFQAMAVLFPGFTHGGTIGYKLENILTGIKEYPEPFTLENYIRTVRACITEYNRIKQMIMKAATYERVDSAMQDVRYPAEISTQDGI